MVPEVPLSTNDTQEWTGTKEISSDVAITGPKTKEYYEGCMQRIP